MDYDSGKHAVWGVHDVHPYNGNLVVFCLIRDILFFSLNGFETEKPEKSRVWRGVHVVHPLKQKNFKKSADAESVKPLFLRGAWHAPSSCPKQKNRPDCSDLYQ